MIVYVHNMTKVLHDKMVPYRIYAADVCTRKDSLEKELATKDSSFSFSILIVMLLLFLRIP